MAVMLFYHTDEEAVQNIDYIPKEEILSVHCYLYLLQLLYITRLHAVCMMPLMCGSKCHRPHLHINLVQNWRQLHALLFESVFIEESVPEGQPMCECHVPLTTSFLSWWDRYGSSFFQRQFSFLISERKQHNPITSSNRCDPFTSHSLLTGTFRMTAVDSSRSAIWKRQMLCVEIVLGRDLGLTISLKPVKRHQWGKFGWRKKCCSASFIVTTEKALFMCTMDVSAHSEICLLLYISRAGILKHAEFSDL